MITVDEAIQYARAIQKKRCCYRTVEGDNKICDCKYYYFYEEGREQVTSEATGCCEARGLIEFLEALKSDKSMVAKMLASGVSKTEAQAKASRENGKKGGRPKGQKTNDR